MAARQAAALFVVTALAAAGALWSSGGGATGMAALAAAGLILAAVITVVPWTRWPHRATLVVVAPAVGLVGSAHVLAVVPARSYGLAFMVIFAWIGIHHPRRTALFLAPLIGAGYSIPIVLTDSQAPLEPRTLVFAMVVGVLVAETIATNVALSTAAERRAGRAADSFSTVGRATSRLVTLEATGVLEAVVDTVIELGYDGVHLGIVDRGSGTFQSAHARGIAESYSGLEFPLDAGVTGLVASSGEPFVMDDYQESELAIEAIRASGARTTIGVPVLGEGDDIVAVLLASYARPVPVEPEDLEALKILAAHAGAALAMVARLEAEQHLAATSAMESRTDPLTGIANRRRAQEVLADLVPGDSVALLDIDRFKAVNDVHGHDAGDRLLRELALFLAANIRAGDHVARFGGEEFLIVLPHTPISGAALLLDRLRRRWEATGPAATFSAGAAEHEAGEFAPTTLARADAALYRAKDDGRNRVSAAVSAAT